MIIFTDIDDTIMQTKRKIVSPLEECIVGANGQNNLPLSFVDPKRQVLLNELLHNNITIPVTARSRNGFAMVKIPFKNELVLNFGATIIKPDGSDYTQWKELMLENSYQTQQHKFFKNILSCISKDKLLKEHLSISVKTEPHFDVYLRFILKDPKSTVLGIEVLKNKISQEFSMDGYYFHNTYRELNILPSFIKKEIAVKFLIENHYKNDLIVGIGDHENDFGFMSLCDFCMFPTDSMISHLLKEMKNV